MNDEMNLNPIDPELEARIVALVLGEVSDFERDQLEQMIVERPELAKLRAEIEGVHGLLDAIGQPAGSFEAGESEEALAGAMAEIGSAEELDEFASLAGEDADWKLSDARRQSVLAVLDGEESNPVLSDDTTAELTGELAEEPKLSLVQGWLRLLYTKQGAWATAAAATGVLVGGGLLLNSVAPQADHAVSYLAQTEAPATVMTEELHDGASYFESAIEAEPSAEPSDSWSRFSAGEKTSSELARAPQSNSKAAAKSPAEALDAIRGTLGTEATVQGQTLPNGYYLADDVQYLPAPSKGVGGPGPGLIAGTESAESSGPAAGSGAGVSSGVAGMGMGLGGLADMGGGMGEPTSGLGPGGDADFGDRDGLAAGNGALAGNSILSDHYGITPRFATPPASQLVDPGMPDISKFGVPSRAAPAPAKPKADAIALLMDDSASMEMPHVGRLFKNESKKLNRPQSAELGQSLGFGVQPQSQPQQKPGYKNSGAEQGLATNESLLSEPMSAEGGESVPMPTSPPPTALALNLPTPTPSLEVQVPDAGTIKLGGITRFRDANINSVESQDDLSLMVTPRIIIQDEEEMRYGKDAGIAGKSSEGRQSGAQGGDGGNSSRNMAGAQFGRGFGGRAGGGFGGGYGGFGGGGVAGNQDGFGGEMSGEGQPGDGQAAPSEELYDAPDNSNMFLAERGGQSQSGQGQPQPPVVALRSVDGAALLADKYSEQQLRAQSPEVERELARRALGIQGKSGGQQASSPENSSRGRGQDQLFGSRPSPAQPGSSSGGEGAALKGMVEQFNYLAPTERLSKANESIRQSREDRFLDSMVDVDRAEGAIRTNSQPLTFDSDTWEKQQELRKSGQIQARESLKNMEGLIEQQKELAELEKRLPATDTARPAVVSDLAIVPEAAKKKSKVEGKKRSLDAIRELESRFEELAGEPAPAYEDSAPATQPSEKSWQSLSGRRKERFGAINLSGQEPADGEQGRVAQSRNSRRGEVRKSESASSGKEADLPFSADFNVDLAQNNYRSKVPAFGGFEVDEDMDGLADATWVDPGLPGNESSHWSYNMEDLQAKSKESIDSAKDSLGRLSNLNGWFETESATGGLSGESISRSYFIPQYAEEDEAELEESTEAEVIRNRRVRADDEIKRDESIAAADGKVEAERDLALTKARIKALQSELESTRSARIATLGKRVDVPKGLDEKSAEQEAFSTFSLHVSDVSFKLAHSALTQGQWPEAAKVRIEEFVNALDYRDPFPTCDDKVACQVEQGVHPFLQQRNVMRVSMRTAETGRASSTPLCLTLLLDNSGSMERPDRQRTVRRAFELLTKQLQPNDQVTLISFASSPRLLADKVSAANAAELLQRIENLPSQGGTNIESALQLAFEKAVEQQVDNAQNRVVLLTDGAVNLGNADPEKLSEMVITMRDRGIAFDAAGISAQDLNDEVLEALTRKGDGRYYLLDSLESADDGFARQIAGALRPSAKNVKVQVEFNPKRVGQYKLLGYEKHRLKKEDFRNDAVDAAEMAAAEAGVAVYQFEAKPDGVGDVGSVSVRFMDMDTGRMVEKRWPIPYEPNAPRVDQSPISLRLATAASMLAAKLRGEPLGETVDLKALANLLAELPTRERNDQRVKMLETMIQQARQVSGSR